MPDKLSRDESLRSTPLPLRSKGVSSARAACADAGLGIDVVPHSLRHTAIIWLMQAGVDVNEVSGFAGVSVEELERTYWHHSPDFQGNVAIAKMGKRRVSGRKIRETLREGS